MCLRFTADFPRSTRQTLEITVRLCSDDTSAWEPQVFMSFAYTCLIHTFSRWRRHAVARGDTCWSRDETIDASVASEAICDWVSHILTLSKLLVLTSVAAHSTSCLQLQSILLRPEEDDFDSICKKIHQGVMNFKLAAFKEWNAIKLTV